MAKYLKNVRINPITNEPDFYFPMEVTNPADKEYARLNGLVVGMAMLGNRRFEAIMIPCKRKDYDMRARDLSGHPVRRAAPHLQGAHQRRA